MQDYTTTVYVCASYCEVNLLCTVLRNSVKDRDLRFPSRKIKPERETRVFFEGSAARLVCLAHTHTI